MIDEKVVEGLKARYPGVHPLIFHRSVEKARSGGELFDILETLPDKYPVVWSESDRRWLTTTDLVQVSRFQLNS